MVIVSFGRQDEKIQKKYLAIMLNISFFFYENILL